MMGKKILIIGFGNMGFAHFKSFYKKNYTKTIKLSLKIIISYFHIDKLSTINR